MATNTADSTQLAAAEDDGYRPQGFLDSRRGHWYFASCNTTTLDGAPLLLLFRFVQRMFPHSLDKEEDWEEHIHILRNFATSWNRNVPDKSWIALPGGYGGGTGALPAGDHGIARAWPVRTILVLAPMHVSPRPFYRDEPAHLTVAPARHYWINPDNKPDIPFEGFWGGVHVYGPEAGNYQIHSHPGKPRQPEVQPFGDSNSINQIRLCVQNCRLYRRALPSQDYEGRIGLGGPLLGGTKTLAGIGRTSAAGWPKTWGFSCPDPVVNIRGNDHWAVYQIVNSLYNPTTPDGYANVLELGLHYQVSWTGWPPDKAWYPAKDFANCPAKVEEFHNMFPTKPGPPASSLITWHKAYIRGRPYS